MSELDDIQRRADDATPGPWGWDGHVRRGLVNLNQADPVLQCSALLYPGKADAEFIAHARTDVAYLLALVRTQQATLAAVLNLANTSGRCGWRISADELRRTLRGES